MKIDFALFSVAAASHFRAIGFEYEYVPAVRGNPVDPNSGSPAKMVVTRSIGWRRGPNADGYTNMCQVADIDTNESTGKQVLESITGPGLDESFWSYYTVTNIEMDPSVDVNSHWCFGRKTFEFELPAGTTRFDHRGDGCCTIPFSLNDGTTIGQGSYGYKSIVENPRNSSPHFFSRAIWVVAKGCEEQHFSYFGNEPGQVIPDVDPENDRIRCRWATSADGVGRFTYDEASMNAFELDEDTCIVTYRPEHDTGGPGNKPIAIMIEDRDRATNDLQHAVPSIFIAVTFEPNLEDDRSSGKKLYAGLIPEDDDDDHYRRRRSFTEQAYCDGMPRIEVREDLSEQNSLHFEWQGKYGPSIFRERRDTESSNVITIPWSASYKVGDETFFDVPRFQFSNPSGMTCAEFDEDGETTCTWVPTAEQAIKGHHSHCAEIFDPYGRPSNRICINIIFDLPDCPAGFRLVADGDSIDCQDIDECKVSTTCGANESCKNTAGGFECSCRPGFIEGDDGECVFADNAELTLQQWVDMTSDVLVGHGRAGKFTNRVEKLFRNAFYNLKEDCKTPFNAEKYGGSDFFDWSAAHSRSDFYCAQTTQVKEGFQAFIDNYSCADGKNSRQVHRVTKFLEKLTNPYC